MVLALHMSLPVSDHIGTNGDDDKCRQSSPSRQHSGNTNKCITQKQPPRMAFPFRNPVLPLIGGLVY
jgi:hypothetical protein